ncbi:MAG: UDP-N-acetylmuramate:L-alanyl-gamma-D-glutamyl-meso-diaminopimelate ligase [Betaproteobacteria bacterium]|nr:UDP-N-acetylmuramate:L-alanyl-gamma-D-glutamyl-meso-diaminopimelate ligase [Betaproteobacteria bacterium]
MHIHILGICGTFMGGIAAIAREAGHRVTGCDANVYPPMSTQLAAQGIELVEGYSPAQVDLTPDVFVIGNVVTRGNALMEEILDRALPYISGPQWLAENVLRGRWVLAVAGTHGKTTTASMLAWILEYAGLAPGFLIGGVPENFGVSARLTTPTLTLLPQGETKDGSFPPGGGRLGWGGEPSPFFVIEADEYDTAFFDKRSKFVHCQPRTAVLNNLEFDHADIFPDLAAIETQFHHFVRTIPASGLVVANGADPNLERVLARGCWTPVERFGIPAGWNAGAEAADGAFDVLWETAVQGRVRRTLPGAHNRLNALAAIAAAHHAGVPPAVAIEALGAFRSVRRRMEVRGVVNGITVYDDFAHHPTAIEMTLAGLRAKVNGARIIAVLEPRSNTMKLGVMKDRLAASLAGADRVFCYSAGLAWDAGAVFAPLREKVVVCDDFDRLLAQLSATVCSGDHVLIMSNGGFGGIHGKLLARLAGASAR